MPDSCNQDRPRDLHGPAQAQMIADGPGCSPLGAGRILVTGASGFIGSTLARRLAAAGHEVTCLLRPTSSSGKLEGVRASLIRGDVADGERLREAIKGKSVVYHLAGSLWPARTAEFYRVNEEGTRNLLRVCSQTENPPVVVFVSSIAAAGPSLPDRPRIESDPSAPVSHYGRSKLAAESAARRFAHLVPITVVRPPIVLGEGDRYGLPMFKTVARLGLHFAPGRCMHRYSVVHVYDVVDALVLAAERGSRLAPPSGDGTRNIGQGVYFVADEEAPTYAKLGRMIGEALGRSKTRVVRVPLPVVRSVALGIQLGIWIRHKGQFLNRDKFREIAAGSWVCSTGKATEELGFRPAAALSERLRQTAAWYRRAGWL